MADCSNDNIYFNRKSKIGIFNFFIMNIKNIHNNSIIGKRNNPRLKPVIMETNGCRKYIPILYCLKNRAVSLDS